MWSTCKLLFKICTAHPFEGLNLEMQLQLSLLSTKSTSNKNISVPITLMVQEHSVLPVGVERQRAPLSGIRRFKVPDLKDMHSPSLSVYPVPVRRRLLLLTVVPRHFGFRFATHWKKRNFAPFTIFTKS